MGRTVELIHPSSQDQMDLSLLFYGREECLPGHSWGPGLRDTYILHYVHSGRGVFTILDQTYELEAGQGFLITPSDLVFYQADHEDPWVYSWVGFRGLNAKSLLQRAGLSARDPIVQAVPDEEDACYLDHFYEDLMEIRDERTRHAMGMSILYRLLAELIRCSPSPKGEAHSTSRELYIRQAINFIKNHYSQKISLQDIADEVGLDRTYLSGLFKAQYGQSLQTFLLEYRMSRAAGLLQNKGLSISDVSRSVGYTDPFLFSKMFKKVYGMSPRKARESGA